MGNAVKYNVFVDRDLMAELTFIDKEIKDAFITGDKSEVTFGIENENLCGVLFGFLESTEHYIEIKNSSGFTRMIIKKEKDSK